MLPWQLNTMVIGHKHMNWVDNDPMIINAKYGSHHFNHLPIISPCCHGNQTKSQITIILAIFKPLTQATFSSNKGQITSMALEELSFESVNGWTDR